MSEPTRSADGPTAWFWSRVARAADNHAQSLALFRVVFCLNLLFFDAPFFAWIDRAPRAFFAPPFFSLTNLLPTFPPAPFFSILDCLATVSLCMVTVGYRTRAFTWALFALNLVGFHFHYSFGKIDHSIVTVALLGCMAFADWGRAASIDALVGRISTRGDERRRERQGLALFAVFLAFGMLTASVPKLLSWIDFNLETSGFLSWYYPQWFALGRQYLLASLVPRTPQILFEAGDYFAAIFELVGFLALLRSARDFRLWLAIAAAFHLLNTLTLNIPFATQALAYAVFVNWRGCLPGARSLLSELSKARGLACLGALAGVAGLPHLVAPWTSALGYNVLFVRGADASYVAMVYVAVPVCALSLGLLLRDLRAHWSLAAQAPNGEDLA